MDSVRLAAAEGNPQPWRVVQLRGFEATVLSSPGGLVVLVVFTPTGEAYELLFGLDAAQTIGRALTAPSLDTSIDK